MKNIDQKLLALYLAIVATTLVVFFADVKTSLGTTVWVFYFVPMVLSYFLMTPLAPIINATGITILVVVAFYLKPVGMLGPEAHGVSELDRWFCGFTVWALGVVGFQFIKTKLEVRHSQWLQSGQTTLSQKMVGDPQLDQLGDRVLSVLAEFLHAQAGAVYVEQGGEFRRFATYGVPPDANVPQKFTTNEGLLGQAVKEGRIR